MNVFLLADEQVVTRLGMKEILSGFPGEPEYPFIVQETLTQSIFEESLRKYPYAIVIADPMGFDFVSETALLTLYGQFPDIHWLLFSDSASDKLLSLSHTNQFSYVLKKCVLEEIRTALGYALKRETFICNPLARNLLHTHKNSPGDTKDKLTVTETEILRQIALGKSAKEIAALRFSSVLTITTHKKNIFRKLEVNNIHDATKYALKAGLIDPIEYYI